MKPLRIVRHVAPSAMDTITDTKDGQPAPGPRPFLTIGPPRWYDWVLMGVISAFLVYRITDKVGDRKYRQGFHRGARWGHEGGHQVGFFDGFFSGSRDAEERVRREPISDRRWMAP